MKLSMLLAVFACPMFLLHHVGNLRHWDWAVDGPQGHFCYAVAITEAVYILTVQLKFFTIYIYLFTNKKKKLIIYAAPVACVLGGRYGGPGCPHRTHLQDVVCRRVRSHLPEVRGGLRPGTGHGGALLLQHVAAALSPDEVRAAPACRSWGRPSTRSSVTDRSEFLWDRDRATFVLTR